MIAEILQMEYGEIIKYSLKLSHICVEMMNYQISLIKLKGKLVLREKGKHPEIKHIPTSSKYHITIN